MSKAEAHEGNKSRLKVRFWCAKIPIFLHFPKNIPKWVFLCVLDGYDVKQGHKICPYTLKYTKIVHLYISQWQRKQLVVFNYILGSNICSLILVKTCTLSILASPYGDAHI